MTETCVSIKSAETCLLIQIRVATQDSRSYNYIAHIGFVYVRGAFKGLIMPWN